MKREEALPIAQKLISYLSPACEEIVIAGSLRRGKEEIRDLDILLRPKPEPAPRARPEFGKPPPKVYRWKIDQLIGDLEEEKQIHVYKNGPRLKKFIIPDGQLSINVDLSIVYPPARFGVLLAIRTGPSDFSHWLVSRKRSGGALPDGFRIQGGAVYPGAAPVKESQLLELEPIGFDAELTFLEWLGLGWIEPKDRAAQWGITLKNHYEDTTNKL